MALGYQNGDVSLLKYNTDPLAIESLSKFVLDGPISAVVLFEFETEIVDLLVVSAVGYCILYRDVAQDVIDRKIVIRPPCTDALTTATASDIDFDGQKEIIIGSFSKEIFCYKIVGEEAQILWKIDTLYPVQSICEFDINKDGINELVVVSMYAVSILLPNHSLACNKLRAVREFLNKTT